MAGASGSCCTLSRHATIRAATLVYITIAFAKLSHFSSRRSSMRQPLFSVKCYASIGQRHVYFRTTSWTSGSVVAGSRVHHNQCSASPPGAGCGSHTSTSVHARGHAWGYFSRSGRSVVAKARLSTVAVRAGLPCDRGTVHVTLPSTGWARTATWANRHGSSTRRFCTHRMIALSPTSSTHGRTS